MLEPIGLNQAQTNFTQALNCVEDGIDNLQFESKNPLMILLLTDGKPEPQMLDPPKKILQKISQMKEKIPQWKLNFIIYTIGIGNEKMVDKRLLSNISKKGNGEYKFADDFRDLTKWFEKLANNFSIVLHEM